MAEVTGTLGGEPIELNNAATESTLRAMLASLNRMNSSIVQTNKMLSGSTGGPGTKGAEKGLQDLGASAVNTVTKLSPLTKGFMLLGAVLGDLAASAFKTVGNLMDFAGGLIDGRGRLSDLVGAFKDLPLGLGAVAGLFQSLIKIQEAELDTYRVLVKNGVSFGGQLSQLRLNALSLGMTLDEFGSFVRKNQQAFLMMGSTVNEGAERFVKLGRALRDSNIGSQLLGMGYTFEDLQSGAAEYIRLTGGRTASEMKNTKALIDGTGAYLKELDLLAQITGQSREEAEKQLQEQMKDAAFENYLQTLDEEGRKKAMAAMGEAMAKGGKGAADALKYELLGLPPLNEASQTFVSLAGTGANAIKEYSSAIKDQRKGISDIRRATGTLVVGLSDVGKKYGPQFGGALIAAGGDIGQFASQALKANTEVNNKNVKNAQDYVDKVIVPAENDAKKRAQSQAAAAAKAELELKKLGESLYAALLPAIQKLVPEIQKLAIKFTEFVQSHMPEIQKAIEKISTFVANMFSEKGRQENIKMIGEFLGDVLKAVFRELFGPSAQELKEQGDQRRTERVQTKVQRANYRDMAAEQLAAEGKDPTVGAINTLAAQLEARDKLRASGGSRARGSLGETGSLFENFGAGTQMTLHGIESVITPEQLDKVVSEQSKQELLSLQNNIKQTLAPDMKVDSLVSELQALNKQTAEMIRYLRLAYDETRQFVPSIRSLSGNLYA